MKLNIFKWVMEEPPKYFLRKAIEKSIRRDKKLHQICEKIKLYGRDSLSHAESQHYEFMLENIHDEAVLDIYSFGIAVAVCLGTLQFFSLLFD